MGTFNKSKFFTSLTVAGAAFVVALSPFGPSVAQDQTPSISNAGNAAEVSIGAQFIDVDPVVEFDHAILRVSGPDGYALTRTISAEKGESYITADLLFEAEPARQENSEEPVPWNHLPDGKYYFEIQFYSGNGFKERQSGSFKVEGGTAVSPSQHPLSATPSNSVIERIAGALLDILVPSAYAQTLESHSTTGDFDDYISIRNQTGTGQSRLNLNTIDSQVINADTWRLSNDADDNRFEISEGGTDNRLVILQGGNVGIGTDAPLSPVHIDRTGGFQLRLTGSGADYRMDSFGTSLRIGHSTNTNQFRIFEDAAFNSLVVGSGGNIGLGTASPDKAIHVLGDSPDQLGQNNTMLRVENNSGTTAARRMIELVNNGSPLLVYRDTSNGNIWNMSPVGNQFKISLTGTGAQEFELDGGGNLAIQGSLTENSMRSSKTNFHQVDERNILEKLQYLSLEEWSYKHSVDNRHLGPMAEDFHSIFGLGPDDGIAPRDLAGVALAAAKALKAENDHLRNRLDILEQKISAH